MFLDPNDPQLTGDPTGDVNSPDADKMKQILGLLQGHTSLAGAAGPNAFQMPLDQPLSGGGMSAPPNALQLPAEAPPPSATSHIDELMNSGLLTPTQGGQPIGPPPGGPGGPGGAVAPPGAPKPPMVDRIHDWLQSKLSPNIPQATQGLLQQAGISPEELNASKVGLGGNIAAKILTLGMGNTAQPQIDRAIALHKAVTGMAGEQAGMAETARIRDIRQNASTLFPELGPNATEDDQINQLRKEQNYYISHGDMEAAKEIGPSLRALWARPKPLATQHTTLSGVKGDPNGPYAGQNVDALVNPSIPKDQPGYLISETPKAPTVVDPNVLELRREAAAQRQSDHADSVTGRQAAHFMTQNKALVDTAPKYTSFMNALAQAKLGNPAALQTTLYGFVNNTDMNAQMRQGILQKLEQITPGISQMTEAKFTQALAGKLTPSMIANMEAIVSPLHRTLKALYQQRYDAALKRNPGLKDELSGADELFDIPDAPTTAAAPAPAGAIGGRDFMNSLNKGKK